MYAYSVPNPKHTSLKKPAFVVLVPHTKHIHLSDWWSIFQTKTPRSKVACNLLHLTWTKKTSRTCEKPGSTLENSKLGNFWKGRNIYIYICILCTKSYLDDDSKTQLKAPVVITTHQKVVAIHLMFHHFTYRRYTGAIFELAFWTIIRPPPKKRMILLDMISNISQLSTGKYMIYHMILLKRYLMDW